LAFRRVTSYTALVAGIAAVSFAAILIRLAEAPPPLVAALRMIFASALLAPLALRSEERRREVATLAGSDLFLMILAGVFLSLHFILWIWSLSLTDVASSVVFVTTNPLFVALYTVIVFRERVSRTFWVGLMLAIAGGATLGGNDLLTGGGRWKGDILALLGSIAVAGYFLVGSRLRRRLSLFAYILPVYATAAVILAILLIVMGVPITGYGWQTYLYCFLMALVCQLFGHSLFNWALRHMKATIVTVSIAGEPVGASILALLILGEAPVMTQVAGGGLIIGGIILALYFNPGVAGPRR
jgi:drug/metabolite transporter (DMT)-like permease